MHSSVIAGEAKDPRRSMPRAFNTIVNRLIIFFIGGALCVGVGFPMTTMLKNS